MMPDAGPLVGCDRGIDERDAWDRRESLDDAALVVCIESIGHQIVDAGPKPHCHPTRNGTDDRLDDFERIAQSFLKRPTPVVVALVGCG